MNGERRSLSDDLGVVGVVVAALALVVALLCGGLLGYRLLSVQQRRDVIVKEELRAVESEKAARQQALAAEQARQDAKLRIVAWNVESGGNDPSVIAKQLQDLDRYDICGLTVVSPGNTTFYLKSIQAHGDGYRSFVTVTGSGDRMMMVSTPTGWKLWRTPNWKPTMA